jgi:hypothetical protein
LLETLTPAELQAMAAEPYEPRGILHSEMALIIHTCRRLGVRTVVESGRARGQSTYMLAKYMAEADIHSVELRNHPDEEVARERLAGFSNVRLVNGDGTALVPMIAASLPVPLAILLDGPKGAAAVAILEECFRWPHVRIGFIHDMRRLDHGAASPHRAVAMSRLPRHAFSDDAQLVAGSSWMDAQIIASGGPAGPAHEAVHGSYGPTVGVFLNPCLSA